MLLTAAMLAGMGTGSAGEVFIVDTVNRAETHLFGQAFERTCPVCGAVHYRNMGGDMKTGRAVAQELHGLEKAGTLSLVVTLGRPATMLLADNLETTPILYTMVGKAIPGYGGSRHIVGFPTDAPLALQLELIRGLVPKLHSVGIVVSEEYIGADALPAPAAGGGASGVRVRFYPVRGEGEIATTVRKAVQENDALLFLRDHAVLNNDSVRFILQYTLENLRYTVVYSRALTDLGFTASLVARPQSFGDRVGTAANHLLKGEAIAPIVPRRTDYDVHLNRKVFDQLAALRDSAKAEGSRP